MTRDRSNTTFDRALALDEQQGQACRRRHDGRRRECGRDRRDRARDAANSWVDREGRAPRPEEREDRRDHRKGDRRTESLVAGTRVEPERELEHRQGGPVRELDRRDAADEERERGLPRQRSLGLGAYR